MPAEVLQSFSFALAAASPRIDPLCEKCSQALDDPPAGSQEHGAAGGHANAAHGRKDAQEKAAVATPAASSLPIG